MFESERRLPVVVINDVSDTKRYMNALRASGIRVAEITFRTKCAAEAIALAAAEFPDMTIGAGTVLDAKKCREALDAGARFVVSPGFSTDVAKLCGEANAPYYPGCATPTEITQAIGFGFEVLKFFPAHLFGGINALRAYASVFPGVRFIPTGGVNAENESEFLAQPNVAAVGGTYLMKDALAAYGG